MRTQHDNINSKINKIRERHYDLERFLLIKNEPNPIKFKLYLFKKFKKYNKYFKNEGNYFYIGNNVNYEILKKYINKINNKYRNININDNI